MPCFEFRGPSIVKATAVFGHSCCGFIIFFENVNRLRTFLSEMLVFAKGLSLFSSDMCTGFERFFEKVSFGSDGRHVFEVEFQGPCPENVHRRRDRV